MRRSTQMSDKQFGSKRSILNNAAYSIFRSNEVRNGGVLGSSINRRVNFAREANSGARSFLQRSFSADNVVNERGLKPSDLRDPVKRNFIENLTSKILHFDMESGNSTPINLQKLLTPASDANEITHVKNKKMYASSYFYAPTHPTVEDQVELARRISNSLSDVKNVKSKGQSMYVNRKKRSVKWIHDGNGVEDEEETLSPVLKDKVPLKCMMNPSGKVLDIHGIQALGEEVNIQTIPQHPERLFDIVRDLNTQKGRGAEIFAKRRKRSEKWVVDTEQSQSSSNYNCIKTPTYSMKEEISTNETSKFDNKPFYHPFSADMTMDYSTPPTTNCAYQHQHQCSHASFSSAHSDCSPCHTEVKKIYLREVAVGTDPEPKPSSRDNKVVEKLRRLNFDDSSPCTAKHNHKQRFSNPSSGNGHARNTRHKSMQNGNYQHHCQSKDYQSHQLAASNGLNNHHCHGHNNRAPHNHRSNHHGHTKGSNAYYQQISGNYSAYQPPTNGYQNPNHNGHHHNGNGYQDEANDENEEINGSPDGDYTPVPVKQLIQEFEKTCKPIMQLKQYCSKVAPVFNNQSDISRFFECRREAAYQSRRESDDHHRQRKQCRGNGYASSGIEENGDEDEDDVDDEDEDDEEEDTANDDDDDDDDDDDEDEDEDEDESLDDSLSPVNFYRVDDRRLMKQSAAVNTNRSSSMSTIDEYYRRQLQQTQLQALEKLEDERNGKKLAESSEVEGQPINAGMALAIIASQDDLIAQKKQLRSTPVLENLVAGTVTPECFKKEYTEEVAGKLYDNTYQGPKISSYQNLTNYNTAPRGWDQSQQIYRPIRFEKPQDNKIVYSDF